MSAGTKFANTLESGFTLTEMLVATVVVLVGLVAVAQLVPASMMMNSNNRNDGTALVFAQQQMEALREQPLNGSQTFADPLGVTCPLASSCNLGDPTQPKQIVGSPVAINGAGAPIINFAAAKVSGYSFSYTDPNDPFSAAYDVRWAVVCVVNTQQMVTSKRFIVGVFRPGMKDPTLPITLDSMVEK